ncbi:SAM-dependent methyltransferase [Deinococcus enclensis]|uniref:Cyclopropane fatty-acyl-phospholipid synthase-like methyltransferase n=1 Tax=Deinococcus enclensis TaxID=1049582 RepID=A0ABT9MGM4_9DEIO|nr:methyltransferase domain-containing protein [Deinococcus enclensis]MDP9765596.1 cyclopropane fatty-acyl-phospholipid synthase-like methyltransferase [Deinococcus enclensis]
MHFLEFFTIVEEDRDVLNPVSPGALDRVADYAGLRDGQSVLDIGSGKGAVLRQWAARWAITGTGVDLNPAFVQNAQQRAQDAGLSAALTFPHGPALDFTPDPAGYDVVSCLGATFALGGFTEAARWMTRHLRDEGAVVIGDVYRRGPVPDQAQAEWWAALPTLEERSDEFMAAGLDLTGLTVSSRADWDHYSSLMWAAVQRWARVHPDHPDRAEVLAKTHESRAAYLRWERASLGWAIWVGRPAQDA